MNQSGSVSTTESVTDSAFRSARHGDRHFSRVHAELLTFHHLVGSGMNHYNRAIGLLREAGHDDLAEDLLAPVARGVLAKRWSWSVVEEYEDRFFETTPDLEQRLRDKQAAMTADGDPEAATADGGPPVDTATDDGTGDDEESEAGES